MAISERFKRFQYFNFETNFLKKENIFQITGLRFFSMKPLRLKTSFPFKNALSETNAKTNRLWTAKWTYYKEWSLPVTTLFF